MRLRSLLFSGKIISVYYLNWFCNWSRQRRQRGHLSTDWLSQAELQYEQQYYLSTNTFSPDLMVNKNNTNSEEDHKTAK